MHPQVLVYQIAWHTGHTHEQFRVDNYRISSPQNFISSKTSMIHWTGFREHLQNTLKKTHGQKPWFPAGVPLNPSPKTKPTAGSPRYRLGLSLAICGPVLFEVALRFIFKQPVHEQTAFKSLQGRRGASKLCIHIYIYICRDKHLYI